MGTQAPKGGSKGLDVYLRAQGRIHGPSYVPTAPREDPRALMCTHGPKGGSKGLDAYPRPQGGIQGP